MKFTDAEIDSIALSIYNASREWNGQLPAESLGVVHQPTPWRMAARAALVARDALFETTGERWEARGDNGFSRRCASRDAAHRERTQLALLGHESARVVRVTTKRRKR